MDSVVIAIGGNALLDPSGKQSLFNENRNMERISKSIVKLLKTNRIILTHGNGSQVGDELARNEHSKKFMPKMPLYVINAETQAQIGTLIETSIRNSMEELGIRKDVSVILTHVLVDKNDPCFKKPSKPIGPLYTKKELQNELKLDKFDYIKIKSKYRQVVASPKPKKILEEESIKMQSKNNLVISCGGGGIPMVKRGKKLYGISAVIDKDLTAQLLASSVGAETLVILTNEHYLYKDYKKRKGLIKEISIKKLKPLLNTLEEGTIRPKVEACIKFIENGGKRAYIGNLFELELMLNEKSGTLIKK
ncbi:MAG: carbamate kinase [Candidatus Micrarchaeaceae archaeon]|jgi:carbamate kinase